MDGVKTLIVSFLILQIQSNNFLVYNLPCYIFAEATDHFQLLYVKFLRFGFYQNITDQS